MKFHYIALDNDGKKIEGTEDALTTAELLGVLSRKNLTPLSVKTVKDSLLTRGGKAHGSISMNEKIFLTKYLAIMLKVGIDLFQAITILISDFKQPSLKALLIEIRETLERGEPFYSVFARYPKHFSQVFINLIKSGEASGNLDSVFDGLSGSLIKEKELRGKIRAALVYPALLLVMSFIILILLTTFALPRLANVFNGGNFEPPAFSKMVFTVGLFFNDHILIILGSVFTVVIGLIIFGRTLAGKIAMRNLLLHTPIIKQITFNIAIQRFATTLSSLLKAGVPILEALRITSDTIGHPGLQKALQRVSEEGVSKGLTLGEAFRKESSFPLVVVNLVAIGEKAGHLNEILGTLGTFYESEIDSSIQTAMTFVEPLMLFGIGIMIGTIAVAVIVPIYQLMSQF